MNPDDNWLHVSDIDVPPLTFEVGIQVISLPHHFRRILSLSLTILTPTWMDEPIHAQQVPLPESRPASVV